MNIKQEDLDVLIKKYISILNRYDEMLDIIAQKLKNNDGLKLAITITHKTEEKKNV